MTKENISRGEEVDADEKEEVRNGTGKRGGGDRGNKSEE